MTTIAKSGTGYWWEKQKGQLHDTIFGVVKFLQDNQRYKQEMNLRHMRLYGNVNTLGLTAYNYSPSVSTAATDKLTFNLIQSCCDTVTQKIAKNKPKPTFLTSGGNRPKKKKAQKLSKFVLGQFYETKLYEKAPTVFRDATIFGTGAAKIFRVGAEIRVERTFIDEIYVDDAEAIYGEPQNKYQAKFISRDVLLRQWPGFASQIKSAEKAKGSIAAHQSLADMLLVVEAWHLATIGEDGKPSGGRHFIGIENCDFVDEEYKHDYFPFIYFRWNKPLLGFFGQGLAEQLTGLQIEINKLLRTIQLAFHLCGIPQWWFTDGSKLVKAKMNNEVGSINQVSGNAPVLQTPAPINPIFLQHFQSLIQRGYEQSGISQLSANSQKPAGLDSGKALRDFNDIESERFVLLGQAYEQMFMDAARQFLDLGKEIHEEYKDEGGYSVKVHDRKFMETINWAEVDMSEDEYVMQIFPTSLLSETPSGKLQDVQELMQAGMIDPTHGMDLLDFPDLDSYRDRKLAPLHRIQDIIDKMLDEGKYSAPEPYEDLQLGTSEMLAALNQAQNEGVEEDRLELLRRWMSEADAMAKRVQAANQPAPAPGLPQGQPQAVPAPPPVSDMLPNAPQPAGVA